MSKQTINIGASPNDGTGTPLRTSFDYTNQNFTELYTALGGGVGLPGATTQVIFNDGGTNLAGDAGLVYNKTTDALTVAGLVTAGSASITGAATVGTTLGVTGVSTFAAGTALLPALTTTGDTNTGIYYPAADTFAVTTGGTERYRVDSAGNCGIGVTPSASSACINMEFGGYGSTLSARNNASAPQFAISSNAVGNWYAPTYKINGFATQYTQQGNDGSHTWYNAITGLAGDPITFTTRMSLTAAGNLSLATGNLVMTTSGKGIDFSAVTGGTGTATANVLNDYEEGTWTPVATGLTNVGAVTYTATYTKIGRVVYINLKVNAVTSTTSVANTTYFSGLPFTPALNSTITAVNEGNITSLGVGLIATGSTVFTPNWTAVQNATLSGFYYV